MSLSNSTERKFVESFDVDDWEVESDVGFVPIVASHKTIPYQLYKLTLANGLFIECADTHIVIDHLGNELYAMDSLGAYIKTTHGVSKVCEVCITNTHENMYDIEVDSSEHLYYTNGILSHNTQTTASHITHFAIFSSAKLTAVLANKADQAQEILERIQLSYEMIPLFLQPGLKTYNKRSMVLGNNSKIMTSASSSSSVRGKSIALLYCHSGKNEVTVRDIYTGDMQPLSLQNLYNLYDTESIATTEHHIQRVKVNTQYEILTPNGWEDFLAIIKSENVNKETVIIKTANNSIIEVTLDHTMYSFGVEIKARDVAIDTYLDELDGSYKVVSVEHSHQKDTYEIFNATNHIIVANNFITHQCDEAAFIPNDMQFYESTYPTIASGKTSKIILTSTPNGTRGMFHKLWMESLADKNSYVRKKVTWDMVPGRDDAWKKETIENTSEELFRQEHDCVTGDATIIIKDDDGIYNMSIEDLHEIIKNTPDDMNIREKAKGRVGVVYKVIREDMQEYIGTSLNIKNRISQHKISDRFSEFGILDYEILYSGDYYECLLLEPHFIKAYDTYNNGLNNSIDGKGNHLSPNFTTLGMKYSDEARANIAKGHLHRTNYARGPHTEETKRIMSEARKGVKKYSEKLPKEEIEYIVAEYDKYELNVKDCLELNLIKKTQKNNILCYGWDGVEDLINSGGSKIIKLHPFSYIMSKKYKITTNAIKGIIKEYRSC